MAALLTGLHVAGHYPELATAFAGELDRDDLMLHLQERIAHLLIEEPSR